MVNYKRLSINEILDATTKRFIAFNFNKDSHFTRDEQWQEYLKRLIASGNITSEQYYTCCRWHYWEFTDSKKEHLVAL